MFWLSDIAKTKKSSMSANQKLILFLDDNNQLANSSRRIKANHGIMWHHISNHRATKGNDERRGRVEKDIRMLQVPRNFKYITWHVLYSIDGWRTPSQWLICYFKRVKPLDHYNTKNKTRGPSRFEPRRNTILTVNSR